ncbi:MAG: DUF1289 domain-containing protein [Hyphomonas sp.]|uniref:DUF1289 domain-containing protein n=1 Tax=Hyphomonas sp. TaxID=87 RepID=UPI0035298DC6
MTRDAIKSPCINVCAVDGATGWCFGCGRTLKEIAAWVSMGETGRDEVLSCLPDRIARLEAMGKR